MSGHTQDQTTPTTATTTTATTTTATTNFDAIEKGDAPHSDYTWSQDSLSKKGNDFAHTTTTVLTTVKPMTTTDTSHITTRPHASYPRPTGRVVVVDWWKGFSIIIMLVAHYFNIGVESVGGSIGGGPLIPVGIINLCNGLFFFLSSFGNYISVHKLLSRGMSIKNVAGEKESCFFLLFFPFVFSFCFFLFRFRVCPQ
jgi:hypothetical protein